MNLIQIIMKNTKLLFICGLLGFFSLAVSAQNLEEILTKHEKAIGTDKGTISSAVISGYSFRGTTEIPFKLYVNQGKVRYEASGQNSRPMIQIYDLPLILPQVLLLLNKVLHPA